MNSPITGVAEEVRRRRELLGWSQVRLAREAGVARTVISEIEGRHRTPSIRTYAKLRAALGLEAPPATLIPARPPRAVELDHAQRACACLLAARRLPLADLASALDISVAAARETVATLGPRLETVGYTVTDDGAEAWIWCRPEVELAVSRVVATEREEAVSAEQLQILCVVVTMGEATRADVERYRGGEATSLLARLVRRGLLAAVRDDHALGSPNVYRVTAKALRAAGFATAEEMRAAIGARLEMLTGGAVAGVEE